MWSGVETSKFIPVSLQNQDEPGFPTLDLQKNYVAKIEASGSLSAVISLEFWGKRQKDSMRSIVGLP